LESLFDFQQKIYNVRFFRSKFNDGEDGEK